MLPLHSFRRLSSDFYRIVKTKTTKTHKTKSSQRNKPKHQQRTSLYWCTAFLVSIALGCLIVIPIFIFYDAVMLELHMADHSDEPTKRILFVGHVTSLQILANNWVLNKEIEELCINYDPTKPKSHGYHEDHEGGIRLHIFYDELNEENDEEKDKAAMHELQAIFVQAGCSTTFTYTGDKKASTKSLQRQLTRKDHIHYNAVVNMDLDNVISFPSLSGFHHALLHAEKDQAILCANERQTWKLLFHQMLMSQKRKKDDNISTNVVKNNEHIIHETESCSAGFAIYGWNAWTSTNCDFDDNNIGEIYSNKDGRSTEPHVVFQQCLKLKDGTWIGVQPDLVVWRQLRSPSTAIFLLGLIIFTIHGFLVVCKVINCTSQQQSKFSLSLLCSANNRNQSEKQS